MPLVADFLDSRGAASGDEELELGVIAIVVEVKGRKESDDIKEVLDSRTRPEVEYTPEAEWWHNVWYRCSDSRDWIASGLFRLAMKVADGDTTTRTTTTTMTTRRATRSRAHVDMCI